MNKAERKPPNERAPANAACASLLRDATRCLERAAMVEYLLHEFVSHFVPDASGGEPARLLVALTGGARPADIEAVVEVEQDLLALVKRDRDRAEALLGVQVSLPGSLAVPLAEGAGEPWPSTTVANPASRRNRTKG